MTQPADKDSIAPSRYRRLPVELDAIQWSGTNLRQVIDFTGRHQSADTWTWEHFEEVVRTDGLKIFTLEGSKMATVGDYIIKGVKGECYPCKPDIFWKIYERASAPLPECGSIPEVERVAKEFEGYWYNDDREGMRQMMLGLAADLDAANARAEEWAQSAPVIVSTTGALPSPAVLRPLLEANEKVIEEYCAGYEWDAGEDGYHNPTDEERILIEDAINGLLCDDDFLRTFHAWQDVVRGIVSATGTRP